MKKLKAGYSLIEIMVVLTLFALLILVATQTLVVSLRNTGKSEAIGRVKENLEVSISVMERQLRNAKSIVRCAGITTVPAYNNPLNIDYLDQNGKAASFTCTLGANGFIASASAVPVVTSRLTNQNVSISVCSITCVRSTGVPDIVTINVVADDKNNLPGAEKAKVSNQTTISLRQY